MELRIDSTRFDHRELVHKRTEELMGAYLSRLLTSGADSSLAGHVPGLMAALDRVSPPITAPTTGTRNVSHD